MNLKKELIKLKANKSSKQEDKRYLELLYDKSVTYLDRQIVFTATINYIDVFKYTADFCYIKNGIKVAEEFKGYIFERHDSILRIKIMSALFPDFEFRITKPTGLFRIYKEGKAVRFKKKAT